MLYQYWLVMLLLRLYLHFKKKIGCMGELLEGERREIGKLPQFRCKLMRTQNSRENPGREGREGRGERRGGSKGVRRKLG